MKKSQRKSLTTDALRAINLELKPYGIRVVKAATLRLLVRRRHTGKKPLEHLYDPALATIDYYNLPKLLSDTSWARDYEKAMRVGDEGWHYYLNDESHSQFYKVTFTAPVIPADVIERIANHIMLSKLSQ